MTIYIVVQSDTQGNLSEFCSAKLEGWLSRRRDIGLFYTDDELLLQMNGIVTYLRDPLGRLLRVDEAILESRRSDKPQYRYRIRFVPA